VCARRPAEGSRYRGPPFQYFPSNQYPQRLLVLTPNPCPVVYLSMALLPCRKGTCNFVQEGVTQHCTELYDADRIPVSASVVANRRSSRRRKCVGRQRDSHGQPARAVHSATNYTLIGSRISSFEPPSVFYKTKKRQ